MLSERDYRNLSVQAKIIVSPWGFGEICYRDFECLLDCSVLIKPRTNFVDTLGDVLIEGHTYEACDPAASDLEEIIRRVLNDERYHEPALRRENCNRVLNSWSESTIVDWIIRELTSVLGPGRIDSALSP